MAPGEATLLCLVLCLGQGIQAQGGDFPAPVLAAVPGPVVPWNGSVRLRCRGTPEAFLYQLLSGGNGSQEVVQQKLGFQEQADFLLTHVDLGSAGPYRCQYRKQFRWSEQSPALDLVVTGLYDEPLLSTNQSLVLGLGSNVSLWCGSPRIPFDRFSLAKEGVASLSQHQHVERTGKFTVGPVTASFAGAYRCYGWHSSSPYVWSAPSNALELVIAVPDSRDYTTANWIRLGLAGLVLLALLAVLGESWHGHRVPHQDSWQDSAGPAWSTGSVGEKGPSDQPPVATGERGATGRTLWGSGPGNKGAPVGAGGFQSSRTAPS